MPTKQVEDVDCYLHRDLSLAQTFELLVEVLDGYLEGQAQRL